MYLVRQIHENTDRVVSGLILTKVLMRNLEFEIELYLAKQIPENTEGDTWIGTDLKLFIGVGHLLHTITLKPLMIEDFYGKKQRGLFTIVTMSYY